MVPQSFMKDRFQQFRERLLFSFQSKGKKKQGFKSLTPATDFIVPADSAFYCSNGSVFYSLSDLRDGLSAMPGEVFTNHVNQEKNDFSNWIHDVFDAKDLAKVTSQVRSQEQLRQAIDFFLK